MRSVDPATGQLIREYPPHDDREVERRLGLATDAFPLWRDTPVSDRSTVLSAIAARLRSQRQSLADLITAEMGKPISQALAEVDKCATTCEHYAEHAARYLATESVPTEAAHSLIRCDPLGLVLAIMPWNFPLWQVVRAAAPALMAGNGVVLKHASNVSGCALAIDSLFADSGAPTGIFTTLLIDAERAQALIADPRIAAVTLTGSDAAGAAVAARAGQALKKCVLELGGSDPFIVLADADLDAAAQHAAEARLINNGQSCICAKRFIVETGVADRFEATFTQHMKETRVGDPRETGTQLGPLARGDLRDELNDQVRRTLANGARVTTGGHSLDRRGFFYAPTVITGVEPGMPAFDEETFGPVAAVTRVRDADHAVTLANASRYGLGASLWTRDLDRAEQLAQRLETGSVFVNAIVRSDPRLPFGGVKRSGYGRELGQAGIREFVNLKTVWVA
jgi:succinate-semialdehyde dehydrogenase / glutarate-semialdehyde dehydrogenase